MFKLKELVQYLNRLLPLDGLSDSCPNGLQIEGKEKVATVATAVTASLATIEAAIEKKADALIVHHGIFWQRDSFVIEGIKKQKIQLLLEHGISLLAYHLPLDKHPFLGNNWKAAQDLGWVELEPFGYFQGAPIGVKGKINPTEREIVKNQLEEYYQHPAACALGGTAVIRSLALISGGAYKSLLEAANEKIDVFITGSFDEPAWHQAFEEKINFFALGHSATERVGPLALAKHLEQEMAIPSFFLDIPNPF